MPERSSKRRSKPRDLNLLALTVVDEATGESEETDGEVESPRESKNPAAVALGRLGGAKGGKARAAKLTAKRRKEIAKKAARARWSKHQKD